MTFAFNHKFAGRAFGNPSQAQLSPRHNLMAINNFSTAKTNTNLHFRNAKSALNCKSRSRDLFLLSGASSSPSLRFSLDKLSWQSVSETPSQRGKFVFDFRFVFAYLYTCLFCRHIASISVMRSFRHDWEEGWRGCVIGSSTYELYEEHDTGDAFASFA